MVEGSRVLTNATSLLDGCQMIASIVYYLTSAAHAAVPPGIVMNAVVIHLSSGGFITGSVCVNIAGGSVEYKWTTVQCIFLYSHE